MIINSIVTNPHERVRFVRFAVVGTIGAVVDFGVYTLLHDGLTVVEVPASIISFIVAVLSNFTLNRYWTYPDSRSKPVYKQVVEFVVVSVIGLIIRTPLFAVLVGPLSRLFNIFSMELFYPAKYLGDKVALAIAVIVVMFWNFFVNRYWTYSDIK